MGGGKGLVFDYAIPSGHRGHVPFALNRGQRESFASKEREGQIIIRRISFSIPFSFTLSPFLLH